MTSAVTVNAVETCIWIRSDETDTCGRPAPYEGHDPAEPDDPMYWWPACEGCAAELRTEGCWVRTIRLPRQSAPYPTEQTR